MKRGLTVGLALLIVGTVINWFVGMLMPSIAQEYQNSALFRPWDDPIMMTYFAYPFIMGFVFSYLWDKVKAKDPTEFAKMYFVIATVPGMFITWTSMQISVTMIVLWAATGFVQAWVAGYLLAKK